MGVSVRLSLEDLTGRPDAARLADVKEDGMRIRVFGAASAVMVWASSVAGQAPPNYGLDFLSIGSPGNRATIPSEVPWTPDLRVGAVNNEYRIMRTNLNVSQYMEFANAYAPFWTGDPHTLAGFWGREQQGPGGIWHYSPAPGSEHYAVQIRWEMAARYCNWLHNGKVNEAWAFEKGAYDTSTFQHGMGWYTHQTVPSPGAKFWIPTLDEFDKAAYYDPNRYGSGKEGYWINPDGSDESLIRALPENGGETVGDLFPQGFFGMWDLGQYPGTQSPWGLIDVSATSGAFTSTISSPSTGTVVVGGSMAGSPMYLFDDRIDIDSWGSLWGSYARVYP